MAKLFLLKGASLKAKTAIIVSEKVREHIPFDHCPFHWPHGTPFHWACFTQSFKAMDILLELGADVDELDSDGYDGAQTALGTVMDRADGLVVRYSMMKGADPQKIDGKGRNPLHLLAAEDYQQGFFSLPKRVRWWIYHGSMDNHLKEVRSAVTALVDAGGVLEHRQDGPRQNTALIDSIYSVDAGPVIALLEAGASAENAEIWSGRLPLHLWAERVDSRRLAYQDTYQLVCRALLDRTRACNAKDDLSGGTFLHAALSAPYGLDFESLTTLLIYSSLDVNVNATDNQGATPLLLALGIKTLEGEEAEARVNFLLRFNPDINSHDNENRDFIYNACANGELSDVRALRLIQRRLAGLDSTRQREVIYASKTNRTRITALMEAVHNGFQKCVKLFLSLQIEMNSLNKAGYTALDWALEAGELVRRYWLSKWLVDGQLYKNMTPRNTETLFSVTHMKHALGKSMVIQTFSLTD